MNWNNRLGPAGDRPLQLIGVQRVGGGINVDENGAGPGVVNRRHRGDKGEWNGNHLIPWSRSEGQEGQVERTGAGVHGHSISSPAVSGKIVFKGFDFLSQDKMSALKHCGNGLPDLV